LEAETGIPLERTILGGFSQGAAMALDVGLSLPVAGLCSLSGYLHFQPQHLPSSPPPIFMVHGQQDMVVPIQAAHQARNELKAIAAQVEYHELAMGHEIPQLVLQLLKTFIENHTVSV
jgi:phospholipase/carboxylesterase